jgi:CheY-like chemotaxis protein
VTAADQDTPRGELLSFLEGRIVPETILLVQEDAILRQAWDAILHADGHEVRSSANAEEGLASVAESGPPNLIVLDLFGPVLDGWYYLERLMLACPYPPPPVIIVTEIRAIDRAWAEAHGCGGCLHRPVRPEDLRGEVSRCLEKAAQR